MERMKRSVIGQLGRVHHLVMRTVEAQVSREVDEELSGPQGRTLHFIMRHREQGLVCQRDIEEEFDLKPSSVSLLLRNMEERGLIYRQSVEGDGRLKSVHLTPRAEELSQRLMDTLYEMEQVIAKDITPEERQCLEGVLRKIRANLGDEPHRKTKKG